MKTSAEMAASVLKRRDEYLNEQKKRRTRLAAIGTPCLAAALALAILLLSRGGNAPAQATLPDPSDPGTQAPGEEIGSGDEDVWNGHLLLGYGRQYPAQELALLYTDEETLDAWLHSFECWGGSRKGDFSTWLFVHEFHVTREDMEAYNEWLRALGSIPYTEEELDLIFDEDPTGFYDHFSNPCAVVVGTVIYSPEWLYEHTVEDYIEEGIPADALAEKIPLIRETLTDFWKSKLPEETAQQLCSEILPVLEQRSEELTARETKNKSK